MIEKVNPCHPDKVADRIAGAMVDLTYAADPDPRISVQVCLENSMCHLLLESSVRLDDALIRSVVRRIGGNRKLDVCFVHRNRRMSRDSEADLLCPSSGLFVGVPLTEEQKLLSRVARRIYAKYPASGTYLLSEGRFTFYQSGSGVESLRMEYPNADVNPLEDKSGSIAPGAANRQLRSDMADSMGSGGLHGKDLTRPEVSLAIYAFLKAQKTNQVVRLRCAAGASEIDGLPYPEIIQEAREYIRFTGGFEKLAEWGLY